MRTTPPGIPNPSLDTPPRRSERPVAPFRPRAPGQGSNLPKSRRLLMPTTPRRPYLSNRFLKGDSAGWCGSLESKEKQILLKGEPWLARQ